MSNILPFPSRARPRSVMEIAGEIGGRVETMIRIQMRSYPEVWSEADKREVAMWHLGLGPRPSHDEPTDPPAKA